MSWRFIDKHFAIFREFLEKNNFTIKEKLFSPKVFGDAYVILESSNTEIRLTKDRSMTSVEMRGKFKENSIWFNLDTILEFMDFTEHMKYDDYWEYLLWLNQLLTGLEKKYMEIQGILNSPESLERLELFREKKGKRLEEELFIRIRNQQVK